MDVDRAKAICEVAQTIINSAKVEVDALKTVCSDQASDFFEVKADRIDRMLEGPKVVRTKAS